MSLRMNVLGRLRGILKNLGRTRIRRPAGPSAEVRDSGVFARSAGIQRNLHMVGLRRRDFAPLASVADCEEIYLHGTLKIAAGRGPAIRPVPR